MLASELILQLREDFLEDNVTPYMWSDDKLLRYLNEAIREACRSPLFMDTQSIVISSGTATYDLDIETLDINEIILASQTEPIQQLTKHKIERRFGLTWASDTGDPIAWFREDARITFYPNPTANDTATVYAFRYPEALASTGDEPAIPELYHQNLLYWCAYKAFMTPDIDTGDLSRATQFLTFFDQSFGLKRSARYDMIQRNSPKYGTVTPVRMC